MKKQSLFVAVGVAICILGAFLMAWGDSFLGENHTGIATVLGIIGIGIITSSNPPLLAVKPEGDSR